MKKLLLFSALALAVAGDAHSGHGGITPVAFNEVTLTGGFWKNRMRTEIDVTVPFSIAQSAPAIERFRRCAAFRQGLPTELPEPSFAISSDLYKIIEGAAYSLMIEPNPDMERMLDSVIRLIGQSQQEDGYLNIAHTCGIPDPAWIGERPYSLVVFSHELYNVGHMYEAAVAYCQATGKRELLDISLKNARHVNRAFFEGDPNYNDGKPVNQAPGHEEIELALCKLYRLTGDRLYLDMAKRFLDIRGVTYRPDGDGFLLPYYAQQHAPVAEQTEAMGHAVRATYLYTAMAQVDALTGRGDYSRALNAIWNDLVSTRMHITGGIGAIHAIEGFGKQYELPNLTAYNETCAAVGNVFFNHAMFLNSGDAKYLDVAELSLFNNALAGINLAGDRFFYVNPLEAEGSRKYNHGAAGRAEWFACACCPPNISRLILQTPGYMYAHKENKIYLTLYGDSKTTIRIGGTEVRLEEQSGYPFDGNIRVKVDPQRKAEFSLYARIPTWAVSDQFAPGGLYTFENESRERVSIRVNGRKIDYAVEKGFAVIERKWKKGDILEIDLPMPVRYVACNPLVEENIGKVAITRGPLVYCAEEPDNGGAVSELRAAAPATSEVAAFSDGVLAGIEKITIPGYKAASSGTASPARIVLIPYYAWNNRGNDMSMSVWLKKHPVSGE